MTALSLSLSRRYQWSESLASVAGRQLQQENQAPSLGGQSNLKGIREGSSL